MSETDGWRWHYMDAETVACYGPWVRAVDYEALLARVEAAEAERDRLREALRPFAEAADLFQIKDPAGALEGEFGIQPYHLSAARAALAKTEGRGR